MSELKFDLGEWKKMNDTAKMAEVEEIRNMCITEISLKVKRRINFLMKIEKIFV